MKLIFAEHLVPSVLPAVLVLCLASSLGLAEEEGFTENAFLSSQLWKDDSASFFIVRRGKPASPKLLLRYQACLCRCQRHPSSSQGLYEEGIESDYC